MEKKTAASRDYLKQVREISRLVNSTLDLKKVLNLIVEKIPVVLPCKACTIRLLDPSRKHLELVAASENLSEEFLARGAIVKEGHLRTVLKGEPLVIYDATSDPLIDFQKEAEKEGVKSILAVPIKVNHNIIGVLRLLMDHHHDFSQDEINFAMTVAEEGGGAIKNAQNYQKINLLFQQNEEHERFLQSIIDSIPLQLVVVDRNQRIVLANRSFLQKYNIKEKDSLGRLFKDLTPAELQSESVDGQQPDPDNMPQTVWRCQQTYGGKWLEMTDSPLYGQDGRLEYTIRIIRDVTAQHLLSGEQMERGKLQGVIEMAATVAHELNSPLFAALGTAQLLREELSDSDERAEELDLIIRNIQKVGKLTKKMASITRYKTKPYVGNIKLVDIDQATA